MPGSTYKQAGVDIDAGKSFVEKVRSVARGTLRPEVMSHIGGFGAAVSLSEIPCDKPVLVSSADGVGTKLKIAFMSGVHNTVGIDLVAMSVNDVVVQGAEPLFFLDYFATSKIDPGIAEQVVAGIAAGCQEANCSLVGGETAELPGMYKDKEYDLAGFAVGIVDRDRLVDGSGITVGDIIIGLESSGLHSNGFSLVRKVLLEDAGYDLDHIFQELACPLGEELLRPTHIYVRTVLNLVRDFNVKGMAHITGGGLPDNLPRVLPQSCMAHIRADSWERPPIFHILQEIGKIDEQEMLHTFNCGIGMAIVLPAKEVDDAMARLSALHGKTWVLGEILERRPGEAGLIID